jgi:hypothetical protein
VPRNLPQTVAAADTQARVSTLRCILRTLVSEQGTTLQFQREWEQDTDAAFVTNYPAGKFLELDGR